MNPVAVQAQVVSAGFVFNGDSHPPANEAEPHTINVFDPAIGGRTDSFVCLFKTPN